jgi:mannitol-1-/sugar-/sorbitol-6-/2-deoxyglucose-6-phosphatase
MELRVDEVVYNWYHHSPWTSPSREQIAQQIAKRVVELIQLKVEPKKGINEICTKQSQKNIPIALASFSEYQIIDAVTSRLNIKKFFRKIHSAFDEQYGKPHPAVYLTTAQKLGIQPTDCLSIEDSLYGILSGKSAKMKCIAVPERIPDFDSRFIFTDEIGASLSNIEL